MSDKHIDFRFARARQRAFRTLIQKAIELSGTEHGDKAAKAVSDLNPTPDELRRAVRWLKQKKIVMDGES